MNRQDRRKRRALERKARRRNLSLDAIPESIRNNPHFQKGLKGQLSPEYVKEIEKAAQLIVQWMNEHPRAKLQWVKQQENGVFVSAALCDVRSWIADSPDAYELLDWLDEKTDRSLSFNMMVWALRLCRAIPMPDGSYYGVEVKIKSAGLKALENFAHDRGTTTRLPPSPCGHCGVVLENASAAKDVVPAAGDISVCVKCYGFNRFDAELRNVKVTDEEFEALDADHQGVLYDMQSVLRGYATKVAFGTKARVVIEA